MSKLNALHEGERCDSDRCEVRRSGIHGRGLFATAAIPVGTNIIQYIGEQVDKEESNERGWAQIDLAKKNGDAAVFIFTLNDHFDIDGNVPENSARLINHSCAPNCESSVENDEIWITAIRDIAEGEELFYNYGFDLESYEDHPCLCGSANCSGYIAGEEHWPTLRRKLAAKKGAQKRALKKG